MSEATLEHEIPQFQPYADGFSVGENTLAYITRMRELAEPGQGPRPERLVGDVLRRTCALGGKACAECGCQAPKGYGNRDKDCSDLNLRDISKRMNIRPEDLLMVGVTADNVGFYDNLENYSDAVTTNSAGINELPGYNAFFARASEGAVLGARLADCGFAAIEFKDKEGAEVIGFVHLSRPNMQGESSLKFEIDGQPAAWFEYALHQALDHYGGEIASVRVHTIAAIKAENFPHTFQADNGPEDRFPGWFEQGLLINKSNPDWKSGDPINPEDKWEPQYRQMVHYQVMRSGISEEQLSEEGMIDPGDLELGHASNHAGAHGKMPDARDAYLVMPHSYQESH